MREWQRQPDRVLSWSDYAGSTDERMYFTVEAMCSNNNGYWFTIYNQNYNDVNQKTYDRGSWTCGGGQRTYLVFSSHSIESSRGWTGGTSIS